MQRPSRNFAFFFSSLVHSVALLLLVTTASFANAQSSVNGRAIYIRTIVPGEPTCAASSCHGTNPTLQRNKIQNGTSASAIQSAINNVAFMNFLSGTLSASDLEDLAAYIRNPNGGSPIAGVSPSALDFGSVNVGTAAAVQTVTLSNTGNAALSVATLTTASNEFVISGGTCVAGGSVAAAANCTVNVRFTPSASGVRSTSLTITHNAAGNSSVVPLSGTGIQLTPVISMSSTALTFAQTVGTTSSVQSVVVSNTGNAALTLSTLAFNGNAANDYQLASSGTCAAGASVAAGSTCQIDITFRPASSGARNANLAITHNASGSPTSISLQGTGTSVPQAALSLNQTSLTFGSQVLATSSNAQVITVTNVGSAALNFSALTLSGAAASEFARSGTCAVGTAVATNAACTVNIVFTPSSLGTRNASLTINSDASNATATVMIAGTGTPVPAPIVTVSPTSVDFGNVTVGTPSGARVVTLSNTGNAALNVNSIGATPSTFATTHNCPTTLAAGASCSINLVFTPANAATATGTLSIQSNASGSPTRLTLQATGVNAPLPALSWSSNATLSFASVAAGSISVLQNVVLINQGPGAATLGTLTLTGTDAAQFSLGGTCTPGVTLAVGGSCSVALRFAPNSAGTKSATLQVSSNGTNPGPLNMTGSGAAMAQAALSLTPPALNFGNVIPGGTSATQFVQLANTGNATVRVTSVTPTAGFVLTARSGNSCDNAPFDLVVGQQCQVGIAYVASGEGLQQGTLSVRSNAQTNAHVANLSGEAVPEVTKPTNRGAHIGGCTLMGPNQPFDPILFGMTVLAACLLGKRFVQRLRNK